MKRRAVLVIPLTVPLLVGALSACSSASPGAERASAVAEQAGCGDLEELDAGRAEGPWVYTCQIDDRTYSVRVFANAAAAQGDPASAKLPRVVRDDVVVLQATTAGATASAYDYTAFD